MNKPPLFWVAVFVGGFLLLVGIPLGIRSVMDAIPQWQKKAEARRVIVEREREERRVVAEKEREEREKRKAEEDLRRAEEQAKQAQADEEQRQKEQVLQQKNQRIVEIYNTLYETAVNQPTRPMADAHQLVLEMHYLWKEVRDTAYWRYKAEDRRKMDEMISKLVAEVDRDKKVREFFGR